MNDYFSRCAQKANDCDFQCPKCSECLSEYMLLRKIIVGLSDPVLKRHVFQVCDSFSNVDALQALCTTFEAARLDVESAPSAVTREVAGTSSDDVIEDVTGSDDVEPDVAVTRDNANAKRCGNCGGRHSPGRVSCPAKGIVCHGCHKLGHFQRCCRSTKKTPLASSVRIAEAHLSPPSHH